MPNDPRDAKPAPNVAEPNVAEPDAERGARRDDPGADGMPGSGPGGAAAGDRRDASERERRERVIHTRVSERLEAELKERAAGLGVSVSNLVRNVLVNAFDLVEGIVADSASVARNATSNWRASHGGGAGAVPPGPAVIGWQDLVLDINAVCARCNAILARGSDAAIAIVRGGDDRPIICPRCLEEIRHGSKPAPGSDREPTGE